jgi:hypothetical protein
MPEFKEMPYFEKYDLVMENIAFGRQLSAEFVEEHLGSGAKDEFEQVIEQGIQPIPERGSSKDKYEAAYLNWIWIGKNDFNFVRKRMGELGLVQFEQAEVEALVEKNSGFSTFMLGLMRKVARRTAFQMTVQEFAYQLQWITPFEVTKFSGQEAIFDIPHCKILGYEGSQDLCQIACQRIYPVWAARQFGINMSFERQNHSCTCTLTPIH